MKINELENQLNLSRANIRFYEKEGLLTPTRKENGYREYSEEDVAILKKIIIFRKLGFSLPEIREILTGGLDITNAIESNIAKLNEQIAELNGALEVCNIIKKEAPSNDSFDENHYLELIQSKENNGEKFMDVVKDYLELEKNSFLSMLENVFFFSSIRDDVKQHGWTIVLISFLVICLLRGLVREFVSETGNFLEGFTYPFFLFGLITLVTFPIFILSRKYKDMEPEPEKPTKHPFLVWLLKTIGVLLYFVAYLLGTPIIAEDIFTISFKNENYVATYDLFFLYWFIGLYVFGLLVYLYSKHGLFPDRINGEDGLKPNLPKKVKYKVTIFSVITLFASLIPSMLWYDCFTENGLKIGRVVYYQEYTWDEIDYYTLSAGFDGTLTYSVVMKDGMKYDCIGGGTMISMASLSEEEYPDYDYDFVRYLSRKFAAQGVELKVDDWDKLYKDLEYESWDELAEDIQEIAGQ